MTDIWKTISHFCLCLQVPAGTFPKVRTKLAIRYLRRKLSETLCESPRVKEKKMVLFVIDAAILSTSWELNAGIPDSYTSVIPADRKIDLHQANSDNKSVEHWCQTKFVTETSVPEYPSNPKHFSTALFHFGRRNLSSDSSAVLGIWRATVQIYWSWTVLRHEGRRVDFLKCDWIEEKTTDANVERELRYRLCFQMGKPVLKC
ncbi:hypothetical protein CEXT_7691 [Caerostris extrusa]|uniref:Transposase n=1 Tax=Caerostris extrusa TaxID=172846 RepID=A0AAV4XRD4_CAEEX|nr:hypothetical protein CEXT_7691 [Caerostris extrusa]